LRFGKTVSVDLGRIGREKGSLRPCRLPAGGVVRRPGWIGGRKHIRIARAGIIRSHDDRRHFGVWRAGHCDIPRGKDGCLPGLELGLEATAGQTPGLLSVSLHMTNTGDRPLMPGIYESELLVDGQPDPSWRLALNGALETELLEIPAGETADLDRELQVVALTPGLHEVAVRIGEQSTPGVRVEVE